MERLLAGHLRPDLLASRLAPCLAYVSPAATRISPFAKISLVAHGLRLKTLTGSGLLPDERGQTSRTLADRREMRSNTICLYLC